MPEHRADDDGACDDEPVPGDKQPRRRGRRVSTEPPEGSDPNPAPEPARHSASENDEQLKRDKPPHWG